METVANLDGYIKVKLSFKTWDPVHIRSHVLKTEYKINAPYIEEVSIWVLPSETFPRLSAYQKSFDRLITLGIVPDKAQLHGYTITEGDTTTLAYREKELQ